VYTDNIDMDLEIAVWYYVIYL